MKDFKADVTHQEDLPIPHSEVEEFMDEERPTRDLSFLEDLAQTYGIPTMGGMTAGYGLGEAATKGLQETGLIDAIGTSGEMSLLVAPILAGGIAGGAIGFNRDENKTDEYIQKRRKWERAQGLERSREDFSRELENYDFVVVRDHMLGDGEPLERNGEVAAALYNEAQGPNNTQFFEKIGRRFPDIDYQLSLFQDDEPVREFYAGDNLVDTQEPFNGEIEGTVSVEDYV